MRFLFWLTLAGVLYGSLYPFNFVVPDLADIDWAESVSLNSAFDMVNNVILFLPVGMFAWLASGDRNEIWKRYVLIAFAVAALAQFGQVFVPERYPGLLDIVMNTLGIGFGGLLAQVLGRWVGNGQWHMFGASPNETRLVPVLLIAMFLGYQLYPYLPAMDVPHLKFSAKLVLQHARVFRPDILVTGFALWFPLYVLLLPLLKSREWRVTFLLLAPAVYFARILIWSNVPNFWEFCGALLAVCAYLLLSRRPQILLLALGSIVLAILLEGLLPMRPRPANLAMNWIPFSEFFGTHHRLQAAFLMKNIYLYGSLLWLAKSGGMQRAPVLMVGSLGLLGIEVFQMFYTYGRPELTDPALFLLAAGAMGIAERIHNR